MKLKFCLVILLSAMIGLVVWTAGCSGGSSSSTSMGMVTTSLTDPPTCAAPNGPFTHVYVSISDVKIHQSAGAGPNDAGWVDLTPNLSSAPKQIDLLSLGGNGCVLAQLGATQEIQAGSYQQIRLYLAPNSASVTVAGNQCGAGTNNCVVYNNITYPLNLSSESQTGIKIPSGQIAGGKFTVDAGQVRDLMINFDACASIVVQGNGKNGFRLKPVLHAGEASLTSTSIAGQLTDTNGNPISGATGIVALEQTDGSGVDRMIMQTTPDANGYFVFCPVPDGTYDVVAVIQTGSGVNTVAYAATVTSGVQPGDALGKIPMHQDSSNLQPGMIEGVVTTKGTSGAISEDVTLSALEAMTIGGNPVQVTVPLAVQQTSVLQETTVSDASCPSGTDCVSYGFSLPATQPYLGAFSSGGTSYAPIAGSVGYTVDALAFQPGSGSTPTCSPSELTTALQAVTSGATTSAPEIDFTGCE
jgi:hypothetical protein